MPNAEKLQEEIDNLRVTNYHKRWDIPKVEKCSNRRIKNMSASR